MNVQDLPQIFRDCCAVEDGRYAISMPFVEGEHVYATDGRIIVRMPIPDDGLTGELGNRPVKSAPELPGWNPADYQSEPTLLSSIELVPDTTEKCSCCDGCGQHNCGVECKDCDGQGSIDIINATQVGPVKIGNNFLRILQAAGASLYMRKVISPVLGPVRFVAGTCEGMVMPRGRED